MSNNDKPTLLPPNYKATPSDVCSGRGKSNWSHPGNVWYRQLVKERGPAYRIARTKREKKHITSEILKAVRERGGKFLKVNRNKQWYDIGDLAAYDKISHSLRDQVVSITARISNSSDEAALADGTLEAGGYHRFSEEVADPGLSEVAPGRLVSPNRSQSGLRKSTRTCYH